VASSRSLGVLFSLLAATLIAGCGEDTGAAPPLQASASSSVGCKSGQGYQHTTLGYHLCFPNGWTARDYTAEPGSGGAVSVVAFGAPSTVPAHVPASGTFTPPIEIRVVTGPKDQAEASLAGGNQVTQTTVAGINADRILVVDSGQHLRTRRGARRQRRRRIPAGAGELYLPGRLIRAAENQGRTTTL